MRKVPNGKRLFVGGRNYDLLDRLLQPLIHVTQDGKRIVLRTTTQQIETYFHLVEGDDDEGSKAG